MKISNMQCNRITNPLGFFLGKPRLSWIIETQKAKKQLACIVQVALDEQMQNIVYDSGKRTDISSIGYTLDLELVPYTRYYWQVQVATDAGDVTSQIAWFETAKMDQPWQAQWITPEWDENTIQPLLRKQFSLSKEVTSARLYISGLGLYEAEINGERVGDEYFTPYCNSYDNWIQYQTFDVTNQLYQGANAIGVMLADGWYKGRFGWIKKDGEIYGDRLALICELAVTYRDGSKEVICSDDTWQAHPSYIISSSIYDGEVLDANKLTAGWSEAKLSEVGWSGVRYTDIDKSLLEDRRSIPVKIMEEIRPLEIITTPNGETVLDMGQNMVGWLQFKVDAPQGHEIYLQYGEELQDGIFSQENLRSAKAEFTYISDGKPATVIPHFTFYGFRYVKITGWPGELNLADFTGHVVYSDLQRMGTLETSDPKINRLYLNALWGQKGNFLDVPTDCPQRDERMGWTGDAQMFSGTACFNMDCGAFFSKYLYDLAFEQKQLGGMVPDMVPGFKMKQNGSAAWSEAATVIPWNLYLHYGDKKILEQQLDSMIAYIDFIKRQDDGDRLWNSGFHYGDWLALDGKSEYDRFGGTPTDLIATAYYAYSSGIVAKTARVLEKNDLAAEYEQLAAAVKQAFCDEFVTPNGRLAVDTQTAYVVALYMDLVPDNLRPRLIELLAKKLADNNNYLTTGFVGTSYLCRVLSDNGLNDIAYTLLLNEESPSWLYAVNLGATTIWERWNSLTPEGKFGELGMNSLNHYTYGSVVEWMYRNMCGINPLEEYPGFSRIRIAPQPDRRLDYARARVNTAVGEYVSGWEYTTTGLQFEFTIPFNVVAEITLPGAVARAVKVNDQTLAEAQLEYRVVDGNVVLELETGQYQVIYSISTEE